MSSTILRRETLLMPSERQSHLMRSLGLAFAFSILIALSAQVVIPLPFTPVPLTGQTFAVLLCGALLGARWGAIAVVLYLCEGALGLPVFKSGGSGADYFVKAQTAGYLLAFPLGAALTGFLCERGWDRTPVRAALAMLLGSFVILAGGWFGLSRIMPADVAFAKGVLPFLPGDVVKIALAAALLPLGWKLTRRDTRE